MPRAINLSTTPRGLALAAVTIMAACADRPTPTPAATPKQWSFEEEWRVGGEAVGPHSFDFNLGLALLPRGGFVHYDYKAHILHFLDPEGHPLRSVGRQGNGPGEFAMVNGLVAFPDGRVIVSDAANGFVIFSDSAVFIDVVRPEVSRASTGRRWDASVLNDGHLVENLQRAPGQSGPGYLRLVWSQDLLRADTLPGESCGVQGARRTTSVALKDTAGAVMVNAPLMHAAPEQATAFDRVGAVWEQRDPTRNEIVRHGLRDCKVAATIRLPGERATMDAASRANMIEMANAEAKRWRALPPELDDFPTERPWYQSLHVDSESNVWVERIGGDGNFRVEVYAADGEPVAEFRGTSLPVSPIITATHVYGFVQNMDGVRYLVSRRIVK
jgi:hypothetical protein